MDIVRSERNQDAFLCFRGSDPFPLTVRPEKIHDVFLSFRGEDTRMGFVSHLYAALSTAGILTFIDDKLERRDG